MPVLAITLAAITVLVAALGNIRRLNEGNLPYEIEGRVYLTMALFNSLIQGNSIVKLLPDQPLSSFTLILKRKRIELSPHSLFDADGVCCRC